MYGPGGEADSAAGCAHPQYDQKDGKKSRVGYAAPVKRRTNPKMELQRELRC